jgi:hypothetical protein
VNLAFRFDAPLADVKGVSRTIEVREDQTLADLHETIREAFGWLDDQSPTRRRHSRSGPRSRFTSPSGSESIAFLIRSRSLRPSRRSDFSASGRTSIRQPG